MVWKLHSIIKMVPKQPGKYTKKVRSLKAVIQCQLQFSVLLQSNIKWKDIGIYEISARNGQLYKQWKYKFVSVLCKSCEAEKIEENL